VRVEDVVSELAPRRGFLKLAGGVAGAAAGIQMLGFNKLFAAAPMGSDTVQDIINAARTAEEVNPNSAISVIRLPIQMVPP